MTNDLITECCQNDNLEEKRPLTILSRKLLAAHRLEFQDDIVRGVTAGG